MPGARPRPDPTPEPRAPLDESAPDRPPALTPWRVGAWTAELLSVPAGIVQAYLPLGAGIDARTREQLILAVSETNGARTSCWVHGAWLDFLGRRDVDEALHPLFDYARSCAEAGVPLDTTTLDAAYPPAVVRSVRATVATAHLSNFVGGTAEGVASWAGVGRGRVRPGAVQQVVAMGIALPFVAPTVALAVTMKVVTAVAPSLPEIELPPAGEANLVVHLLAEAVPTYLANTAVRTGLVWSPVPVTLAVRIEGVAASVRLGRGRVTIHNGVHPDALVIVDGGSEPLLQVVTGSLLRDLARRRH